MSASTDELARLLPVTLRSVIRLIGVEMDGSDTGIRLPQYGVLDFLLTNSEAVQTDLANHFAKDKSVMLRQLDEMEQEGWIERQMDPNDRRRKNLVVTKAGVEVHKKVSKMRAKVFAGVLDGVNEKDIATCLKVINAMNEKANSVDAK
ncbi:MAG: winged helix-turn-helix transcriptional regulator [Flavobacteriales bacterium]|nr:winged helix-turn-helix transcriptional regulator [Flavobacteriales bacterium]